MVGSCDRKKEGSEVACEILAYLYEHSDAQDTLTGIVEWWLLEREVKRRTVEVEKALAELVAQGLVIERKTKDSQLHYRMNRRKSRQIASLLNRWFGRE